MVSRFIRGIAVLGFSLALTCFVPLDVMALNVDIFSGHSTSGGGAPFSNLAGSFTSPDISFATSTGYDWHPFGLGNFGADITGILSIPSNGNYIFSLNSDDGSLLFIDGVLVIDNGGTHGPTVVASPSTVLTAGNHPFEVQFFEDLGGPSGVDLSLPSGVTYAAASGAVPEPGTITLLGLGLVGLGFRYRRMSN